MVAGPFDPIARDIFEVVKENTDRELQAMLIVVVTKDDEPGMFGLHDHGENGGIHELSPGDMERMVLELAALLLEGYIGQDINGDGHGG
jgi:hypothetical protein